jgi:hypothetical protein
MALTITENLSTVFGAKRVVFATVVFDSSYPTGGEVLAASDFDSLTAFEEVGILSSSPAGTEVVVWDRTNSKLAVFTADGTEQGNGTDASGVDGVQLIVIGY